MIIKIYLYIFIFITLLFSLSSCLSTKRTVVFFQRHKNYYQKGDFSSLSLLSKKNLLKAHDNKKGTLYYGGLLLFFNKRKNLAEISFRRASRTGENPWAQESARIVIYIMSSDARYNQIIPFIESIYQKKTIVTDAELFHYYALSLFLSKEYKTLEELLKTAKKNPLQHNTLRERVTIDQGKFSYDLWKTLLAIQKHPTHIKENNTLLFTLFSTHRAKNIIGNITALIEKVYKIENIDNTTKSLLNAKLAVKTTPRKAFKKMIGLNPSVFIYPATIQDILKIQTNTNKTLKLLKNASTYANAQQDIMLTIAIAQLYFLKKSYKKSYSLYSNILESPLLKETSFIDPSILKKAQWRMVFSLIQIGTSSQKFIKEFEHITTQSQSYSFFANLLEEYLSHLLRKKSYKRIEKDFKTLSIAFDNIYIKIELNRWESILRRIKKTSTPFSMQTNTFTKVTDYYSDSPFDYLLNNPNISKNDFLNILKQSKQKDPSSQKNSHTIEKFIIGYFNFGLYDYAVKILNENIYSINPKTTVYANTLLNKQGKHIEAFSLIRKKARISEIPQTEEELLLLYPKIYTKNVESLTQNKKRQALTYALIREESSFSSTALSPAGAMGLFQLLPSTAKDIASRINYKNTFDLLSVKDNIILGHNYFSYLVQVVHNPINALVAYNGGLGNLWKWQEKFDTNDLVLFTDSIPFRETRNYIRKVASSAILYALLYYDISPKIMLQYLFKESS